MTGRRPRRAPTFGPELWQNRAGRDWSLWDLWFCIVAEDLRDPDLEALTEALRAEVRSPGASGSRAAEARLSHLLDLAERLGEAGLRPADLADETVRADKQVVRRARTKVSGEISLDWRARTPAMIDTPRRRLEKRARFGRWSTFPADPQPFFDHLAATTPLDRFVSGSASFDATDELAAELSALDGPHLAPPDRLALHRAFHTAALELADNTDDSYGVLAELRTEPWLTYLSLDWRSTGMAPTDYWQDLCELRVWEPYGLGASDEQAWFVAARLDEVPLIESILLDLESELRDALLDFHGDEALTALADLHCAVGAHDRMVDSARRLGSRAWRPIEQMARSHIAAGNRDGALAIFRAADQPGHHRDHLRRVCFELTGTDLTGAPSE